MIKKIHLNFGKSPDSDPLSFNPAPVNLIVGPNNSGKSLFLRELDTFLTGSSSNIISENFKVLKDIDYCKLSKSFESLISEIQLKPQINEYVDENNFMFFHNGTRNSGYLLEAKSAYEDPSQKQVFSKYFVSNKKIYLDGKNRLSSFDPVIYSFEVDPYTPPSSLNKLVSSEACLSSFKDNILSTFNLYPTIFLGTEGKIALAISSEKIPENFELCFKPEAQEYIQSHCSSGNNVGDGVKAYCGIALELIAGDPEVILLDEPEAFLHPPIAKKLGTFLSKTAHSEGKTIFVSTHSSQFIMGCIESGVEINILRLTYKNEVPTARFLDKTVLNDLAMDPLTRSSKVFDALFYQSVIVAEADSDRAFYEEINNRLQQFKPEWAIQDALFLNAQNKQTVGRIVHPLRNLGIPAASILDFDMIKDGGSDFSGYLRSCNIPPSSISGYSQTKNSLYSLFSNDLKSMKTGGMNYLSLQDRLTATHFLKNLNEFGLFPVPCGELESWLSDISANRHGSKWLINKFQSMGSDPTDPNYVKPSNGDVWEFLYSIKKWLIDPHRLGM